MRLRSIATIAAATVLAGAVAGVAAYADIPGAGGVINGCHSSIGSLIVVDESADCPSGYEPINWNQAGPPGPGMQRVFATHHFEPATHGKYEFSGTVACPTGMQAFNAGVWEYKAAQDWVDAVQDDPAYPNVHASLGNITFSTDYQLRRDGDIADVNPLTVWNSPTADGAGWSFQYGGDLPRWQSSPASEITYYAVDVKVWVACAQLES